MDVVVYLLQLAGFALIVAMAWVIYWPAGVGSLGTSLLLIGYLLGRPAKKDL